MTDKFLNMVEKCLDFMYDHYIVFVIGFGCLLSVAVGITLVNIDDSNSQRDSCIEKYSNSPLQEVPAKCVKYF